MTTAADLEAVVSGPGTKSDRARALFRLGCERTDAVELLGMNYSQAHSVWKEMQDGNGRTRETSRTSQGRRAGQGHATDQLGPSKAGSRGGYRLNLGPTQVRVATQDGHEVRRDLGGVLCINCDKGIVYSIQYLAFVHTQSRSEPTQLEDNYGPGATRMTYKKEGGQWLTTTC